MKKRTEHIYLFRHCLLPIAVFAALAVFASSVNNLEDGSSIQNLRQLEDALHKSCVACYACEGFYPPDLNYLEEHYGIQIDKTRYTVDYNIFSENLMPDITVLEQES